MANLSRALQLLALLLLTACGSKQPEEAAPVLNGQNLVLITIDTLRIDRLGAYGDRYAETPTLDAWAREGVRFDNCYSSTPLTMPAHSTLFTGRYPFAHGVRVNAIHYLPEAEVTLAERFKTVGYETFAAVSSYVLSQKFGIAQGFDTYDDSLGSGDLFTAFESEITADRVVDKFERWLAEREPGPFFAWLHFYDPHLPYEPPQAQDNMSAEDLYRGEIAFVDSQLARVRDELERRGLVDRTVLVVTSDHGEAFQEHVEEGHGLLAYNETLKIPLIAHAPGRFPAGIVVESRVRLADLTPTTTALFGLPANGDLHGQSFGNLLMGAKGSDRQVYFESLGGQELKGWAPLTGLLDGRFKIISVPEPELYDLEADPLESENRIASERSTFRDLEARLEQLMLGTREESPQRKLSAEDRIHLNALGYLGSSGKSSAQVVIDPKRGIVIDMAIRRGRTFLQQGDLTAARRELTIAEAELPGAAVSDFLVLRHEIEDAAGNQDLAVAALREVVEQFPALEHLRFQLASYLFSIGETGEAERISRELLAENPRMSQAHNLLAAAARRRDDPSEALEHFRNGLEIEPQSIPLKLEIVDLLLELQQPEAATEIYDQLIEDNALDRDPDRMFQAAMLHGRVGDIEAAVRIFRRGLEIDPQAIHRLTLAFLLARSGQADDARRELEIAMAGDLSSEQRALGQALLVQLSR